MARHRRRRQTDRGAVTVEAAVALVAFAVLLGGGLCGVATAADQIRCVDAAREAARLTARGEEEQGKAAAARIAPAGAEITIAVDGQHIEVDVHATAMEGLLGIRLHAEAFAVREPDG
jgi:Flp pilus assembly protein TadG